MPELLDGPGGGRLEVDIAEVDAAPTPPTAMRASTT